MLKIHKFDLLVSLYIFCIVTAELMGAKTFPLFTIGNFTLNASTAVFVIPIIFTINDIIIEVHGKERARSVVRSGLIVVFLIFLYSILTTMLPASESFASSEAAFDDIFGKSIRISAASLIAFAFAEFLDIYIFSKIRDKFGKSRLWLRNNASNITSQFFDTVIFMSLAFYALDKPVVTNVSFLASLIIPWWLLKSSMSIIETPFVYLGVNWLRKDMKINK